MAQFNKLFNKIYLKTAGQIEIELKMIIANAKHPEFTKNIISTEDASLFASGLLSRAKHKEIEQTIRFVKNMQSFSSEIKELHYTNGNQDKSKKRIFIKKSLRSPIYIDGMPSYKLSFSSEIDMDLRDTTENEKYDIVYVRLRESIYDFPNWRIDITIRKIINVISITEIKSARDILFTGEGVISKLEHGRLEIEYEYIGKKIQDKDLAIIDRVMEKSGGNANLLNELQYILRRRINGIPTIKKLTIAPIEFNRKMYNSIVLPEIKNGNTYVSDKIDGMHALVFIDGQTGTIITNQGELRRPIAPPMRKTIIDAEFLGNKIYMFDIIMYNGKNVSIYPFSKRYEYLKMIDLDGFICKRFIKLTDYKNQLEAFYGEKREYDVDGLIFVVDGATYNATKCYKWKPVEKSTIDFLVRLAPQHLIGVPPYVMIGNMKPYILFSSINMKLFSRLKLSFINGYKALFPHESKGHFPIQFSPANKPLAYLYWSDKSLDNRIVELTYDIITDKWILHKIRDDREEDVKAGTYFGNFFSVAESIWFGYFNPLTIGDLVGETPNNYFQISDSQVHKKIRNYNSAVKNSLFEIINNSDWVLDLGAGKGQDLLRYSKYGIKNLLCVEYDRDAIMELIHRRDFEKKHSGELHTRIFVQMMNLREPYSTNIKIIEDAGFPLPGNGFNAIVSNFAFHYFIGSIKDIENIIKFIKYFLTKKGKFIFTTFNGRKVFDLLEANNGKYEVIEDGNVKCSIVKRYEGNNFTGISQQIDVLLPVSGNFITENLVNLDLLRQVFEKNKFHLERYGDFSDLLGDNDMGLTTGDIDVISLYQYSIYVKN